MHRHVCAHVCTHVYAHVYAHVYTPTSKTIEALVCGYGVVEDGVVAQAFIVFGKPAGSGVDVSVNNDLFPGTGVAKPIGERVTVNRNA